ncbi:amidase [Sphingomonas gilva]|nr:amidase [Sphingomonas gilva]
MLGACAVVPDGGVTTARDHVEERSIAELSRALAAGDTSSEDLVEAYIERIDAIDRAGPRLNSVIAVNPDALAQARASDLDGHRARGPLHGVPILIKDNIETRDRMPTTAGSLALRDNFTYRDAPVVARLRAAGAIILGKTNLSEWANIRSTRSMSGWSAVGGQVRNPYALDRSPCGSSSGSGAAVAASLAPAALGTETDGSVVCPAAMNGLVGFKPSVGLVSRTHIVPISHSQDTAGPMARTVEDAAILLDAMAGSDPTDDVTMNIPNRPQGFARSLRADALKGVRVGVIREGDDPALLARFDAAMTALKKAGAILVAVDKPEFEDIDETEFEVLITELKTGLNAYLATTPPAVTTRTLDDVIAFNRANAAAEMPFFAQETFEMAAKTKGLADRGYKAARAKSLRQAGREGIDAMLKKHKVALLVAPSYGQPWLIDPIHGDNFKGPSASGFPAIAGYPHLTVPMGLADGLPVGLSFIGPAWSDAMVLSAGYAFEQASRMRVPPRYLPSADVGPGLDPMR